MKVKDLIAKLQTLPADAEVYAMTAIGLCEAGVLIPRVHNDEVHILGEITRPWRVRIIEVNTPQKPSRPVVERKRRKS